MKSFKRLAATAMLSSAPIWAAGCAAPTEGPTSTPHLPAAAVQVAPVDCRVSMQPGPMIFSASLRVHREELFRERNPGWELDLTPIMNLPQHLSWSMTGPLVTPTGESGITFDAESQENPEKTYSSPYIGKDGTREWSDAVVGQSARALEQTFVQTSCPQAATRLNGAWNGMLATYAQSVEAHLSAYARVRLKAFFKFGGSWKTRLYEFKIISVHAHCFRPGGKNQILDLGARAEKTGQLELGSPWDTLGCRASMEVDLARGVRYEEVAL